MTIKGSLKTFSLPELFQIIESGNKSGRLTFNPESKSSTANVKEIFELWFDKGNFVTIISSLKQQFVTSKIINKGWIDIKALIKYKLECSENTALGSYLQKQNILSKSQIDLLFKAQVAEVIKLFNVDCALFEFEETNSSGKIPSDNQEFPWSEITGQQIQAKELSLEAMRNLSDWSRFTEEMPLNRSGLQRLVNHCNLQFNSLEKYLCDTADGSISLKKISHKMGISIEQVQQTALSMILAGMVEEVPLINSNLAVSANTNYGQLSTTSVKTSPRNQGKSKASNSLLKNLTNFLKSNF